MMALQVAEKLESEGSEGFNPRIKPRKLKRALAPEFSFGRISFMTSNSKQLFFPQSV
jgi:hypothetical protein